MLLRHMAELCGGSSAPTVDDERRESLLRSTRDDAGKNLEMRASAEGLPDIDAAFPAAFPKPPPPPVMRPAEYTQNYSSCFLACTGEAAASECLGCGKVCGNSFFGAHQRCGECGATFCGDCRATGLQRLRGLGCDDSGWRCVDEDACENQSHALRMVRSYWGPDRDDDDDGDDVDDGLDRRRPRRESDEPGRLQPGEAAVTL